MNSGIRMVMVGCVVLASGCRTPPPMPGKNVLQILAEQLLLHEIVAAGGKVTMGARELSDDGKVVHGHGMGGLWRMQREGKELHGKVEGIPSRVTVLQDA